LRLPVASRRSRLAPDEVQPLDRHDVHLTLPHGDALEVTARDGRQQQPGRRRSSAASRQWRVERLANALSSPASAGSPRRALEGPQRVLVGR
jgi:hypothetical protein